ncbi:YaeQ family protein [Gallaecimonas pentaromativorans]|uniref:YaeQ family protein n=1 Tax=Gallaecimonas pentaromativorans TaxID=584787 RepID=UPI00067EF504|nr:YaeQ family protein [Gallaecimonas pentaromativorans]MED5524031.1 YaeQ family protein [Pseudomonadota bacterium]
MALGATIYKAQLNISDLERHYYGEHQLTLACHPSETETRLMVRLLAFIAHADDDLTFTKGLSSDDEPDLWLKAPDGRILLWIELGEPTVKRIKQGLSRAEKVLVYSYGARGAEQWWKQFGDEIKALKRLEVLNIGFEQLPALAAFAKKNMALSATLMEGQWLLTDGERSEEFSFERWL